VIKHLCSYCGGRDVECAENGAVGVPINNTPNVGTQNDYARVICDRCYVKVFDAILGLPRFCYRYDGTWIREPWLREV